MMNKSYLNRWGLALLSLFHQLKTKDLQWQLEHQAQRQQLKQQQLLAENELAAELTKRRVQLEHELDCLETQHQAEFTVLKTQCQHNIRDYQHYLKALDQLKIRIQKTYAHLPEAVAFTIHHHAKQLLNQMWETDDFAAKMQLESQLMTLMTTIHEDSQPSIEKQFANALPEKTLALLEEKLQ
jgi:hypothetical protein